MYLIVMGLEAGARNSTVSQGSSSGVLSVRRCDTLGHRRLKDVDRRISRASHFL